MSSNPADTMRTLLPDDLAGLDTHDAANRLNTVKICRGFLDAYEAKLTRHINQLHATGTSAPAADLHTRNGGVSSKEARQKERRSKALENAPTLAERLETGQCTAGHADALANVTSRLDDDTRAAFFEHEELLAHDATRHTPEEFARNCRDLIRAIERDHGIERDRQQRRETRLTTTIDRDGMHILNARLHPELGTAIFNTLDHETAKLIKAGDDRTIDRAAIAAEALGNLIIGGHQAIRPAEAEIRLHVTEASLLDPNHHGICEYDDGTPIPIPSVQRLLCNGHIVPIIIDTNGNVLNIGRTQRLANRAQRRALRAMYPTCAFHGCDITYNRCEIHHIDHYEHGGQTDLQNLVPLCPRHHHLIHDQQWTLHLDNDRTLTIRNQHGQIHATVPLPSSRPPTTAAQPAHPPRQPPPGEPPPGQPPQRPPDRPPDPTGDQLSLIA